MRFTFCLTLLALLWTPLAKADLPKTARRYQGFLTGREIVTIIDWRENGEVGGVTAPLDDRSIKIFVAGHNKTENQLLLGLYDSDTRHIIGEVLLMKTNAGGEVVWSGVVKFKDGSTSWMELRRKLERE